MVTNKLKSKNTIKNNNPTVKTVKNNNNDELLKIANRILTEHKKAFIELGKN